MPTLKAGGTGSEGIEPRRARGGQQAAQRPGICDAGSARVPERSTITHSESEGPQSRLLS